MENKYLMQIPEIDTFYQYLRDNNLEIKEIIGDEYILVSKEDIR